MSVDQEIVEAGYDAVYAAMPRAKTLRGTWRDHVLGPEYPAGFEHISFLSAPELERMASEVRLGAGTTLVDLGCGEGGPGLWIARGTGARLIGIDLSAVGVAHAAQRAGDLGLAEIATFTRGTFAETGLGTACCQGVMSVDALQYAPNKRAVFAEAARILGSGGRFVFTAFELDPTRTKSLPVVGTDPIDDYRPLLEEAGFAVEAYEETSSWRERLVATYKAVLARREAITEEIGEEAIGPLLMEVALTLQHQPYRRRILAVSTRR